MERERVLDMERRLAPVRRVAFGILAVALIASGSYIGWWPLAALTIALAGFTLAERGLDESPRPERRIMLTWVMMQIVIGGCVALAGPAGSPALVWLVIPTVTLPARFSIRGVITGAFATVVVVLTVTVGVDAHGVADNPVPLITALSTIGSVLVLSLGLMSSDLEHRSEAVIDPLTGMLNRNALNVRSAELTEQALVSHQPVAFVLGDVDHFKAINDDRGHAFGDAVLCEVAYRIRAELRAYDLAYRVGGEEFLVVLPGATTAQAIEVAEALRSAIEREDVSGADVTMSFGVSVSPPEAFDYERTFASADQALYRAKADGRNCVRWAVDERQKAKLSFVHPAA